MREDESSCTGVSQFQYASDYYGNPAGPERVWLQHEDKPGLAMTRSLGDKIGAQAGVIAEPEILEFSLTPYD